MMCDYEEKRIPPIRTEDCADCLDLWQIRYTRLREEAARLDDHARSCRTKAEKLRTLRGEAFAVIQKLQAKT